MAKRKKTNRPAPPNPTPAESNQLPDELALDDTPPPKPPGQALRDTQRDIEQQGQQVIDDYPSPASHAASQAEAEQTPVRDAELAPGLATVSIEIPLVPETRGYLQNHADFRLSRDQAVAMRRLRGALEQSGARVPMPGRGARPVQSLADTLRWMAQRVCDLM